VHTTVMVGLNEVPMIPVVAHPAVAGVFTRVTVNVVNVFLCTR